MNVLERERKPFTIGIIEILHGLIWCAFIALVICAGLFGSGQKKKPVTTPSRHAIVEIITERGTVSVTKR
jgi:hypothetical protein